MLKFLCFVTVLGAGLTAFAQDNSLFPDLNKKAAVKEETAARGQGGLPADQIPSLFANEDVSVSREDIIERVNERGFGDVLESEDSLSANLDAGVKKQEEEEGKDKAELTDEFIISPGRVQIIEPAIKRFQFCMADIVFQNQTEHKLKQVNAIIHYTPIDMPFEFSDVESGASTTRRIYMATEGCQKLTTVPAVTINVCQAEGMAEEECKSKVKYVSDLELVSHTVQ